MDKKSEGNDGKDKTGTNNKKNKKSKADDDQPEVITVKHARLMDEYIAVSAVGEVSITFSEASALAAVEHKHVQIDVMKAELQLGLVCSYSYYCNKVKQKLRVEVKPRVQVITTGEFKERELILVPPSTGIYHTTGKNPGGAVKLLHNQHGNFYVASQFDHVGKHGKPPFVNPCWAVKKVADSAIATMGLNTVACEIRMSPMKSVSTLKQVMTNKVPLTTSTAVTIHEKTIFDIDALLGNNKDDEPDSKRQKK